MNANLENAQPDATDRGDWTRRSETTNPPAVHSGSLLSIMSIAGLDPQHVWVTAATKMSCDAARCRFTALLAPPLDWRVTGRPESEKPG